MLELARRAPSRTFNMVGPLLDRHVAECARCEHMVQGLGRLDAVLTSTVIVTPPLELQHQLAQLAFEYARPANGTWWTRATDVLRQLNDASAALDGLSADRCAPLRGTNNL